MPAVARVELNEVDITGFCVEGSITKRLNRVGTATVKVNMQSGITDAVGKLLKVYLDDGGGEQLVHHGRVMLREITAGEDGGYAVYNSSDPLELWNHRPVRDPPTSATPGNFSLPTIIEDNLYGPQIVEAMLDGSENNTIPADSEGPLRLARGSFESGVVSLVGAPTDWPMTMAELMTLLVSTGTLDVVITPIELDGNDNYGQIDCYNGDFGTDLTGSVTLSYGMGAFNVRSLRWNTDMTGLCNKLWYFIGPKCDDQHWDANVTADRDFSADGCDPCRCSSPSGCTCNDIRDAVVALQGTNAGSPGDSRGDYDVRMDIKIFDGIGDGGDCAPHTPPPGMCLYDNLWLNEAFIRLKPQELIHVTPARDQEILAFDIGDLITVEASSEVMGGFSGAQRVYSWTASWDANESVVELGEIQVSSDNDGMTT